MRILYYQEPDPASYGGVSTVAYNLPLHLTDKKIDVTYFPRLVPKRAFLSSYISICQQFARKSFDIVHFNVIPPLINGNYLLFKAARLNHAFTVLSVHGLIQIEQKLTGNTPNWSSQFNLSLTLNAYRQVDLIVVNSNYMKSLIERYYKIDKNKIVVIPNGVKVKEFSSNFSNCRLSGDPALLFVGGFSKIKGADILINAISILHSELPKLKLHIVGGGTIKETEEIQSILRRDCIEDHVVYHGVARPSMIPFYLKSVDICVFPSRHEGFGIALLEAMASKKPIIASDIPSFREIGSNYHDFMMFKSGSVTDLSKAILDLCNNSEQKEKISQNALKTAMDYDWSIIADKYVKLYNKLCCGREYKK